jgi:hypothetical protein
LKEVAIFGAGDLFGTLGAVAANIVRTRYLVGQSGIYCVEELFALHALKLIIRIYIIRKFRIYFLVGNAEIGLFEVLHDRQLALRVIFPFVAYLRDFIFSFAFWLCFLFYHDIQSRVKTIIYNCNVVAPALSLLGRSLV